MKKSQLNIIDRLCKKYQVDRDLVDSQEFDGSLNNDEFRLEVEEYIKNRSPITLELQSETLRKNDLDRLEDDKIELIGKNHQALLNSDVNNPMDYFKTLRTYVKMIATKHSNNLIITGQGGLGKSYTVNDTLKKCGLKKDDFIFLEGYSTPLSLYEAVYNNKDKLIVLDDLHNILSNPLTVSILKGLMWGLDGKRVVKYLSTSDKLLVPDEFEFKGQLILIVNKVDRKKDENVKALLTRAIVYDVTLNITQVKEVLGYIAKNTRYKTLELQDRMQVVKYINKITDETTNELNLRSLFKAFDVFSFAMKEEIEWRPLVSELFTKDNDLAILKNILTEYTTKREQQFAYTQLTGRARASFYRDLKKILPHERYR